MPIGNGPDCYNGNVPEEDKQIKLQKKVDDWWHSLSEGYKQELLENYCPDSSNFTSVDEIWDGLDWDDKWNIYTQDRDEEICHV